MLLEILWFGLLSELITSASGVELIRGPSTVSNATIGSTASFECIIDSESVSPRWNINGIDYTVTRLPAGMDFESNSFSKVLIVSSVQPEMNNWCFYCFLLFVDGRVESSRAKLIIPLPVATSISSEHETAKAGSVSTIKSALISTTVSTNSLTTPTVKNINTKRSSSQFIITVSVATAALVAASVSAMIIATIALLIYCQRKNKGKKSNKSFPMYEEVNVDAVAESATVQQNVAYENPLEIKENPSYISTTKLS